MIVGVSRVDQANASGTAPPGDRGRKADLDVCLLLQLPTSRTPLRFSSAYPVHSTHLWAAGRSRLPISVRGPLSGNLERFPALHDEDHARTVIHDSRHGENTGG